MDQTVGDFLPEQEVVLEAVDKYVHLLDFEPEAPVYCIVERVGKHVLFVYVRETGDSIVVWPYHVSARPTSLPAELAEEYMLVDACNGLYVYHVSGHVHGAGDGSETTLADLAEFAHDDPVGFAEAYGPPPGEEGPDV